MNTFTLQAKMLVKGQSGVSLCSGAGKNGCCDHKLRSVKCDVYRKTTGQRDPEKLEYLRRAS